MLKTVNEQFQQDIIERKQAEKIIKEFNEELEQKIENRTEELKLFRNLIDQSNDAIFVINPATGQLLDVNNKVSENLGYSRKELLKMQVKNIETAISNDRSWQELVKKVRQKGTMFIQGEHRRKDGSVFPVEINAKITKEANNEYLVVVARDITERMKIEKELKKHRDNLEELVDQRTKALQATNEQLRQEIIERKKGEAKIRLQNDALEATVHPVMIADSEGIIEWCNQAFIRMTGYSKEEIVGKNPRILKSGKHDPKFYKDLWQTIKSGQVWRGEMINCRKDGTFYPEDQTITPLKDQSGNITHFVAIKQDITERKKAREELQAINEQLDAVIYNMPIGVAILEGPEFTYAKINRTLADINGLSVEDHIGRPLAEVIPQAAKDIIPRLRKVWKSNKTSAQYEFSTRAPKDLNHSKYFIDCFFPIKGKGGNVKAIGIVVLDITNRKESELILKESHDFLEHRVVERTKELARSEKDLIRQRQILEEKNIALNEVIAQIEIEKNKVKENIMSNVDQVLIPSLKNLKRGGTRLDKKHIDLLEKNLRKLSSTFGRKISEKEWNLTPKEIKICDLIRNGLGNKEISDLLNASLRTIESHRNNIRKKLGISGKAVNLTTYLQFF